MSPREIEPDDGARRGGGLEPGEPLTEDELAGLFTDPPRFVLPLEDEPSGMVAWYLFPTERFRGEWRRHPISLAKSLLILSAYTGLLITLAAQRIKPQYTGRVIALLAVGALLLAAFRAADWRLGRFVLTNKRLMLVRGVFNRRVSMLPLMHVTDMRYFQSPLGRLLNYGTFHIDGASRRGGMRRVVDLPHPNELYLRIVEELYEPAAVEARLGRDDVSDAVREVLEGAPLVNYDGWVSVEVYDGTDPVTASPDRRLLLDPDRVYDLIVTIGPSPASRLAEPLAVTGGVDESIVLFEVEVDSDRPALRHTARTVWVQGTERARIEFTLGPGQPPLWPPPWLWIRVSQQRRTLQSIELTADYPTSGRDRG
ncbi:PH domain-containing protein [Catellatospora bangladeshensis]|uniref:YdbS-like PH domain-containing protein n=1 Tax=Catellatospora bangladeshensis TaxID=310355 RepID=A0A8J3JRK6_9ACTN|nr:PH domain-containing protein [Catellatospora bangladeshensis]GIF85642.1 hypothetical protein Cba03nite_69910 [Catellatospora bangladeshensis]